MKKITMFLLPLLLVSIAGFTDNLVLENLTSYPAASQKSKIAVQWASSDKEVDKENKALIHGWKLNKETVQFLSSSGNVTLQIPQKAEYFRVLAWSNGEGDPDFHTNWVDIVPNKTYTLKSDHLVPSVLMSGSGC